MAQVITIAGERLFALKAQNNEQLDVDTFIFANVPGQDSTTPIDRNEGLPPVGQIVHQQIVQQVGRVNDNVVIYSTVMDSLTGPFDFNWVGLYSSVNQTLIAVSHIPNVSKTITVPGAAGNTLNRNFGIEYSGIADLTGITVNPETWQLDYTSRLNGMDELTRQLAADMNGKDWFIGDGFKVVPRSTLNSFKVTAGAGYVSGLRVELTADHIITLSSYPKFVYVDAWFDGTGESVWKGQTAFTVSNTEMDDYIDVNGKPHYVFKLARITAANSVEDLRNVDGLAQKVEKIDNHVEKSQGAHLANAINWDNYSETSESIAKTATAKQSVNSQRTGNKGIISFIFDDGYTSITNTVVPLFKAKGFTCGFAIPSALVDSSSATYDTINNLLDHQAAGFEICNHGFDSEPINNTTKGLPFARSQINDNYKRLRQFGLDVQTWVSPNTTIDPSYLSIVEEFHSSGYTVNGAAQFGSAALMADVLDPYALKRPSLYQLFTDGGLQRIYDTIDAAINNGGWVCFYDHDPEQIAYPTSLSATNLALVLDYCISVGALVLNPRDALDLVHSATVKSRNVAQISQQAHGVVNPNLLRDPWFKTITEPYSGWGKTTSDGTATFTVAQRRKGVFTNEVQLTVGADGTLAGGTHIFATSAQRRGSDAFATSGNLTFSCVPYVTTDDYNNFLEVTIGINQRKTSDNALLTSYETPAIFVDKRPRVHKATIAPKNYSDATYFTGYVRIKDKLTGTSRTLIVANPKLEVGPEATQYQAIAPLDTNDWDFANALISVSPTPISIGVFTKLKIADVNKNFYQTINGEFLCRDTGFFYFDLQVTSDVGGPYTNQRQLVEVYKNGVAEGKRCSETISGKTLVWRWSGMMHIKAGDTLQWKGYQDFAGTINTSEDYYSYLRVCKVV